MMSDKPNLQLGDPPSEFVRRKATGRGIWILCLLQIATLVALGVLLFGRAPTAGESAADAERADEIRATAMALEERNLAAEAATAWREYLRSASAVEDRAQILYRVGGLLMERDDFSGAVGALVAAEQLTSDGDPLRQKIGPKIVVCLRRLGHYGEVGRELSRQVEIGGDQTAEPKLLATFAGESFTEADLDRMIERTVDRLLAMQPEGQVSLGREQILKQYQSGEARGQMLQQIIQRELFSRRARELKIDQEETFQQARDTLETELLASQFLSREMAKILPTDVDLESYYRAQEDDYRQPESAAVVVLPLQDGQSAAEVLAGIQSADDFRKLADETHEDAEVVPIRIVQGERHHRLGDVSELFALAVGEWTQEPVATPHEQALVLVDSKTPAATPPLEQIRFRVEADYRRKKGQELMQQLAADLMSRYDVRIHAEPTVETDDTPAASDEPQIEADE